MARKNNILKRLDFFDVKPLAASLINLIRVLSQEARITKLAASS